MIAPGDLTSEKPSKGHKALQSACRQYGGPERVIRDDYMYKTLPGP